MVDQDNESQRPLSPLAEEVAAKAKVPLSTVVAVFAQAQVIEETRTRRSESLTIRSLLFSGKKTSAASGDGPFTFEWSNLEQGLWLVLSDDGNQIGKSTILEVMLWALRGTPKSLRPEIRAWIHHVKLEFSIGLDQYCVQFDDHQNIPVGTVLRTVPGGPVSVVASFADNEHFEQVMERLMLGCFDLQRSEEGELIHHSWNLYSSSMFISGSHPAILGDVTVGGAWWRMIQLFIGMPYAGVLMAIRGAQGLDALKAQRAVSSQPVPVSRHSDIERLDEEIAKVEAELNALSATVPRPEDAPILLKNFARQGLEYARLQQALAETRHQLSVADEVVATAGADLRRLQDGFAAKRFFAGLKPVCCPRCAQPFSNERLEIEAEGGSCSVCDRDAPGDDREALEEAIAVAKEHLEAAENAANQLRETQASLRREFDEAREKSEALEAEIERIDRDAENIRKEQELRFRLERMRGARDQLVSLEHVAPASLTEDGPSDERRVLNAAETLAEARVKSLGTRMLERLAIELVEVATRIGYKNLESVSIAGNGIGLTVSGVTSAFGRQTAGQRLRLRIALVIAMMRLARDTGQGHHPGLLFIDSPGAEEVSDADLNAVMSEIQAVCDETENLQIFVSSARGPIVGGAVDEDRQRWPKADGYMF
ncbi:UNVERIFIED_ORG: hypothetical protein BDU10_2558 [Burkholderia sp. CF145]